MNYSLFLFKKQLAGVVVWSEEQEFVETLFINNENFITELQKKDIEHISFIKEKINSWISKKKLPYRNQTEILPWQDQWWIAVNSMLIHNVKSTLPMMYFGDEKQINKVASSIIENILNLVSKS